MRGHHLLSECSSPIFKSGRSAAGSAAAPPPFPVVCFHSSSSFNSGSRFYLRRPAGRRASFTRVSSRRATHPPLHVPLARPVQSYRFVARNNVERIRNLVFVRDSRSHNYGYTRPAYVLRTSASAVCEEEEPEREEEDSDEELPSVSAVFIL